MRPYLAPPPATPVAPRATPTFSVVIPAFNATAFISRAVESALAQTSPALEIIVSDDGSTDGLAQALEPYGHGVRLVQGPHGGLAVARNRGYRAASGEFVANLDADDVFDSEFLEAVGELASARPDLDILTTDSYLVHEGTRLRRCYADGWVFYTDDQPRRILQRNFMTALSAVRRSRFVEIGGYDEGLGSVEDWDFWIRLILDGSRAGCVARPLAEYTVREGSLSSQLGTMLQQSIVVLDKVGRRDELEPSVRLDVERLAREKRSELELLELKQALVRGDAGARSRCLAMAADPAYGVLTRLKLAVSFLAPGLVKDELTKSMEREWVGAGGATIERGAREREGASPRIAFYTDASEVGGAEASLANLLSALGGRFDPVVVGTHRRIVEWVAAARPGTSTVVIAPIRGRVQAPALWAHVRALRRLRPDLIQINLSNPWTCRQAQAIAIALSGARVVVVEHGVFPPKGRYAPLVKRLLSRHVDRHVAVGRRSAEDLARFASLSPSSIRTIHNGVPDVAVERRPRTSDAFVVGSLGRLQRLKGYDLLVRALPALEGVEVEIVGTGEERERLLRLAGELGVADRFAIHPFTDEPRQWLAAFDVMVLPSLAEAFPLTILEAMLAEVPVIASDVGSVAEAVEHGNTGILVPPGDVDALAAAIDELRNDPRRRREMAARGRRRALDLFTSEKMADGYIALYDEVLL